MRHTTNLVIPTGAGAPATAEWRNLLFAGGADSAGDTILAAFSAARACPVRSRRGRDFESLSNLQPEIQFKPVIPTGSWAPLAR
jgi:hypothetical protein